MLAYLLHMQPCIYQRCLPLQKVCRLSLTCLHYLLKFVDQTCFTENQLSTGLSTPMPSSGDPADDQTAGCTCLVTPLAPAWHSQKNWNNMMRQLRWADSEQDRGLVTGSELWNGAAAHTSDLHCNPQSLDVLHTSMQQSLDRVSTTSDKV